MPPWYIGDTWRPRIEILDPETDEPIGGGVEPACKAIAPDGSEAEAAVEADPDHADAWRAVVELTAQGTWRLIAESPAPYKDVEVASIYVNPVLSDV